MGMAIYQKPQKRAHKGFFYLNDEVVINSLSALESGTVDEIVSRTTSAREGGFSGGAGARLPFTELSVAGARKSSSEIEEEMVRTRTRFSVFDAWYEYLQREKCLGVFKGWGPGALDGVASGDTIEFRADLSLGSLQTILRLFLWYADQAAKPGTPFAQKGEDLKSTKQGVRMVKTLLAMESEDDDEIPLVAVPLGEQGPQVVLSISPKWMIGRLGQLGGDFGVVAQVTRVIPTGEEYPILRLTRDVTPTPMEIATLKEVVGNYVAPAESLGVTVDPEESVVKGPALVLDPIAVFR